MRLRSAGNAAPQVADWSDPPELDFAARLRPAPDGSAPEGSSMPLLEPGDPRVDPRVVAAFDPHSEQGRAIRGLRSSLVATRADGSHLRSVAILGVDAPAEGSLTAANLAVVCAQAGYRTVLIDANTEAPAQHRLFHLPEEPGVTSVLTGRVSWRDVAKATAIPDLLVVPTGPAVDSAVDLFERTSMMNALGGLADGCDYVIVDASSLGPVEAQLACKDVDGVLLTVRQNRSSMRNLERLAARLREGEVSVLGTIFTY